ncbi:MAG: DUF3800 domain-containing protein [Bacteroidia bacterium]|nr:DUF3800 domain-containing protein [Bacteroidia bacterium]
MKYYLFLDECGDQNLSNFSPDFPIFTLCGVIVSDDQYQNIKSQVNALKTNFWQDKKVVLHSRDIRKCQNGFEILFDLKKKSLFYDDLNKVLCENDYTIVACSILKDKYIRKYGKLSDVYAISLSFIMERTVFLLDREQKRTGEDIELHIVAERRGKKEDKTLLDYYNELLDRGTYFVNEKRLKKYFKTFQFKDKRDDIIGLQITDLVAYPITRFVLDKDAVNLSFEIIKDKIYAQNNKMHGLKIHPI